MFAKIYLIDAPYAIDRPFDYECPESLLAAIRVGCAVKVPFGMQNRLRVGIVVSLCECAESDRTKPVHSVIADRYVLSEEMLGLCLFLKEYTLCTFGDAVRCVLPPGALAEIPNVRYRKIYELAVTKDEAQAALDAVGKDRIRSEGQRCALSYLMDVGSADASLLHEQPGVEAAHLARLVERGLITLHLCEEYRNPYSTYQGKANPTPIDLSPAQDRAYESIRSLLEQDAPTAALLYGVTGSGKTQVMMKAIDRTLALGKDAILLVPEIALTPQTVNIFCRRYGERVAVIHSSLSQGERADAWRRIRDGYVDLVVGTRSAVFAPVENLGLIIIDEEHEHTYKSEQDPKYHARDVAAYRAGKSNALMLLASATPSIESFYKAQKGNYTLVPLRERYGGVRLPRAVIVDMREELRLGNLSPISQRLYEELEEVGEREEQAILFLNRRGYHSQISCKGCGEVIRCPRCSISLTHHSERTGGRLLCHLCGYSSGVPTTCPSCGGEKLSFLGYGTQRVEGDLGQMLSDMPVMRMDADTTTEKLAYDRMLEDFRAGRASILLGTQMVTKGHDFPRVTLSGVVLADTSLYVSDFRASERTFSLLTQVIGRAGRAKDGGVAVIQTYSPDSEVIRLACEQNYDAFYEGEIALRRELTYPPFCDMVQLTLTSDQESALLSASAALTARMGELLSREYADMPFVVYGPFEAQVYKLNDKYRMRIVVKCKLNQRTRRFFHELRMEDRNKDVTLAVDLNPQSV